MELCLVLRNLLFVSIFHAFFSRVIQGGDDRFIKSPSDLIHKAGTNFDCTKWEKSWDLTTHSCFSLQVKWFGTKERWYRSLVISGEVNNISTASTHSVKTVVTQVKIKAAKIITVFPVKLKAIYYFGMWFITSLWIFVLNSH